MSEVRFTYNDNIDIYNSQVVTGLDNLGGQYNNSTARDLTIDFRYPDKSSFNQVLYAQDNTSGMGGTLKYDGDPIQSYYGGLSFDFSDSTGKLNITGGDFGDYIRGGSGNSVLNGGGGNDTLEVGLSANTIDGGSGINTLSYEHYIGQGVYVDISQSFSFKDMGESAYIDNFRNIQNLRGSDHNDSLVGDAGANVLEGGGDADMLVGGGGIDTASYQHATIGVTASLADPTVNTYSASGDRYDGIEDLLGSAFNDQLTGDGGANSLKGADGNDILVGGGGDDRLIGGLGDDDMSGGLGNDRFYVDSSSDTVHDLSGQGTDTVFTSVDFTLGAGESIESLRVSGTTQGLILTGNGQVQTIIGGVGNDILDGGGGADSLYGGAGNDIYGVNDASVKVVELAKEGNDTVESSVNYTLRANVEDLRLLESPNALQGIGNELDNTVYGNSEANALYGRAGNDFLFGDSGNDRLFGEDGNDTLIGDSGLDLLTGGAGRDTFVFKAMTDSTVAASDQIRDFVSGTDVIELRPFDFTDASGHTSQVAWQAFDPAHRAFTGEMGELISRTSGSNTLLQGDINGDKVADFQVLMTGKITLTAEDVHSIALPHHEQWF